MSCCTELAKAKRLAIGKAKISTLAEPENLRGYGASGKIGKIYTDLVEDDLIDGVSSGIRKLWVSTYVGAGGK